MEIMNAELSSNPGTRQARHGYISDPVSYEHVNKSELFPEFETAVEVYREVMEEKDLGRALNPIERIISVFLDPRRWW